MRSDAEAIVPKNSHRYRRRAVIAKDLQELWRCPRRVLKKNGKTGGYSTCGMPTERRGDLKTVMAVARLSKAYGQRIGLMPSGLKPL